MALPAPGCCETSDLGCSDAWQIGQHILANVYDEVARVIPQDCCAPLLAYLTMGDGNDGVVDALTVNLDGVDPFGADQRGTWSNRARFQVRLRESGWPVISEGPEGVRMPDPVAQNALAAYAWSHTEAMYRTLVVMQKRKLFAPEGVRVLASEVGSLRMLKPEGGVVGGVVPVTIFLPW